VGCVEPVLWDQRCYVAHSNNIIGPVIEDGTNQEFESFMRHLLTPESKFKEDCLRLSGLVRMIHDLANSSEGSEIRQYLTDEISLRVKDAFPPLPGIIGAPNNTDNFIRFEINRKQAVIMELFGIHGMWYEPGAPGPLRWPSLNAGNRDTQERPNANAQRSTSPMSTSSGYSSGNPVGLRDTQLWEETD